MPTLTEDVHLRVAMPQGDAVSADYRLSTSAPGFAFVSATPASGDELASERLKAKLGAALIERDLLNEKIALLEAGRPFARRRRMP